MTNEANIAKALLTRMAGLVLAPVLPVAWPDVDFPGKDAQGKQLPQPDAWLEVYLLDAPSTVVTIAHNGFNRQSGILQIVLVQPLGAGIVPARETAGQIINWFKRGTRLYSEGVQVDVYEPPSLNGTLRDGNYARTIVSVPFIAFTRQV